MVRRQKTYWCQLLDPASLRFSLTKDRPSVSAGLAAWPINSVRSEFGEAGPVTQLWVDRRSINGATRDAPAEVVLQMTAAYLAILRARRGADASGWPRELLAQAVFSVMWACGSAKRANRVVPAASLGTRRHVDAAKELCRFLTPANLIDMPERQYRSLQGVTEDVLGSDARRNDRSTPAYTAICDALVGKAVDDLRNGDTGLPTARAHWLTLRHRVRRRGSTAITGAELDALHGAAREAFGRVYSTLFALLTAILYAPGASTSVIDADLGRDVNNNGRFYALHILMHGDLTVHDALGAMEPMAGLPLGLHPATSLLFFNERGRAIVGDLLLDATDRATVQPSAPREAFATALKAALFAYAAAAATRSRAA